LEIDSVYLVIAYKRMQSYILIHFVLLCCFCSFLQN